MVPRRVPRRLGQKGNQQNRTDSSPRSRPTGPTQVCHLTPLPGAATLPAQAPQRSLPGAGGCRSPGVRRPSKDWAKAFSPRPRPPPPGLLGETPASLPALPGPSGSSLNPRPRLPAAAAPRPAGRPGQPSPAALTCEPRPGPSIAPGTAGTPRSGGCNPLASAPRASRIPLPARGPASAAAPAHACTRQSASGKPIPALLSSGGGTFLPPGRRVGNRELEAPPPRPRGHSSPRSGLRSELASQLLHSLSPPALLPRPVTPAALVPHLVGNQQMLTENIGHSPLLRSSASHSSHLGFCFLRTTQKIDAFHSSGYGRIGQEAPSCTPHASLMSALKELASKVCSAQRTAKH